MNLHEYQSKELLASYGLPVLRGHLAHTPGQAEAAADLLGGPVCVVKAQVHAGGRGKGGGVKLARGADEAREVASRMLGMNLVTPQTGPKGKLVRKVYIEDGCRIAKEFYLSLLVDREHKCISVVVSREGGMDIETVAHDSPEKIVTARLDPAVGLQPFQSMRLGFALGLEGAQLKEFGGILAGLYLAFLERDLSLVEINPLVLTEQGNFVILDAKCTVDDNALFRHPKLRACLDYDEIDPKDLRAGKLNLSYVALEGEIGCMVNGAGLAMATMDIIKAYGGRPANFLDVGGGASRETVTEAFKLLLSDHAIRGILVNIFGGIMRCDVIAGGIVEAAKALEVKVPLVVRLQGTNVELGREILAGSGLTITPASTMDEAAERIVKAVKGA